MPTTCMCVHAKILLRKQTVFWSSTVFSVLYTVKIFSNQVIHVNYAKVTAVTLIMNVYSTWILEVLPFGVTMEIRNDFICETFLSPASS